MRNKKSDLRKEYDLATRQDIVDRDKARCVLCQQFAHDIHEIVPRSAFGYDKNELLFSIKNRVCLCRDHHSLAHTFEMRCKLLNLLKQKYGYEYNEKEFEKYLWQ